MIVALERSSVSPEKRCVLETSPRKRFAIIKTTTAMV
jgi:hypothetical protein